MRANKQKLGIATLIIGMALSMMPFQASAEFDQSLAFSTCALSIHPFKVGGTLVNELANQWFNRSPGDLPTSTCTAHLQYPNRYTPIIPTVADNPFKNVAGVEDKYAPKTIHNHIYHDASKQDQDGTPADNYWYKSYMAKFQIILEADALQKVYTNDAQLICGTPTGPGTYVETPCNGGHVNYWGGTDISFNSSTGVVTWDFAQDAGHTGRPMLWGNNPTLGKSAGYLGAYVKLVSKDNPEEVWAATTTSRALIRHLALKVGSTSDGSVDGDEASCANDGDTNPANDDFNGNWCTTQAPNIDGVENTNVMDDGKAYYWFRIGIVGTTWRKPDVPPPPEKVCSALNLKIDQNGDIHNIPPDQANPVAGLLPNTGMDLTVTPSFTGTGATPVLHYTWKTTPAAPANGAFKDASNQIGSGVNPFIDGNSDTLSYYTGGAPSTKVIVDAYDINNDKQDDCHQEFTIPATPPPSLSCDYVELIPATVNPPNVSGGVTNYTARVHFVDSSNQPVPVAQTFNTGLQWVGTNGTFLNGLATQNQGPQQTNNTNNPFQNTFTATNVPASVTAKVTSLPPTVTNSPECQNGATVDTPPQQKECLTVNLTSTGGNPLDENEASILKASGTNTDASAINFFNWTASSGTFVSAPGNPAICMLFPFSNYPATCSVLYTGGPAGSVITATAVGSSGSECSEQITVQGPEEETPVCTDLTLNKTELDADGSTTLTATATFSDGGNYTATIDWNGNGTFNGTAQPGDTQTDSSGGSNTIGYNPVTFDANNPDDAYVDVFVSSIIGAQNSSECQTPLHIVTPPQEYECEGITPIYNGDEVCLDVDGGYTGSFTWEFNNESHETNSPNCIEIPPNTDYNVFATDEEDNELCQLEETTPDQPPRLEKWFSLDGSSYRQGTVTVQATEDKVFYQLAFLPNSPKTSARITDSISETGYLLAQLLPAGPGAPTPGRITYNNDMEVFEQGYGPLPDCSTIELEEDEILAHCYSGNIGQPFGVRLVRVDGKVTIKYSGAVDSALKSPTVCQDSHICQEKYRNHASAKDILVYTDEENPTQYPEQISNEITVQIFCQYILTRAAGDIFLETDLTSGVDILQCSRYRSSTGVIITPGTPTTPELNKTGGGEGLTKIFEIGHEICTSGQAGELTDPDLKNLYGQDVVQNLSSQICEVRLRTGSPWKQEIVTNSVDENKTRVSRWDPTLPEGQGTSISGLVNQYPDEDVYHIKGANLTVDQDFTLNDGASKGHGAKTFIIENGDLVIKSNIKYGTCAPGSEPCGVRDVASMAFIVINGNVYVDPGVSEIAGVYYVQEGDLGTGKLFSGSEGSSNVLSNKKLTVYGSIYGDLDPLFTNRFYSGDPSLDEGGIVIRFDERVILNTPPGLRDVLNLSQTEVAR